MAGNGTQTLAVATPDTLAFFTTHDTRHTFVASGRNAPRLTNTERFEKRANTLATAANVHGVSNINEAITIVKALPADTKFTRVFFVGHGFDDGFFLSGKPDPQADFIGNDDEVLKDPAQVPDAAAKASTIQLFDELAKHLHTTNRLEIGFLSCFTGTGSLVNFVCRTLDKKNFRNFKVGGYINDYQTQFVFDQANGKILKWTDGIFDKKNNTKLLQRVDNNAIPAYETHCISSNPIDPLDS